MFWPLQSNSKVSEVSANFGNVSLILPFPPSEVATYILMNIHSQWSTWNSNFKASSMGKFFFLFFSMSCTNIKPIVTLLWEECEDETHTPKMGTWESARTPKTSEFNYRGQNTSHCDIIYIIGKLSKRKCRKWACMSHLDIYSTSYDKKKPGS